MQRRKSEKFIVLVLLLLIAFPDPSKAGIPSDQIRQTADKVLMILKDPGLKAPDKKQHRWDQLRQVIVERFDFNEMAKRSLGQHWQRRSPEEQRQFAQLFTDLLERSYADQIESFNGEKIVYGREAQDKDHAEVDTKVVSSKGEEYSVNYKLHTAGREWKVYDVVIENISVVSNYRSQFNRVLATSNFEELLRKLQGKNFAAPVKEKPKAQGTNPRNSTS